MEKFEVEKKWFDAFKSGEKKCEGRWNKLNKEGKRKFEVWEEKFKKGGLKVKIGLRGGGEPPFVKKVEYMKKYGSYEEMLNEEKLERVLPGVATIEEGVDLYEKYVGYKEGGKKFGVWVIGFEKEK